MKGIGSCGESANRGRGDVSLDLPQTHYETIAGYGQDRESTW